MDHTADLQTWQEAFEKHPISATRAIERQLRASVASNRDRLRSLVGGNYRELLSTAEQIVALDGQTRAAESHISEIGQRCKPPPQQRQTDRDAPRKMTVAQLRLLQRCTTAAKSAVSKGDLLQAAQLIVISRLLLKSLSNGNSPLGSIDCLREKTASIRRQLLRRVDTTLASPYSKVPAIVNASCAYCLATSASFQDVFKHIQRLRLDRLRKSLSHTALIDQYVVDALRYYVASLRLMAGLTGRTMTDALGNLQKRPILQEPSILELDILDLKGFGALIPEEIESFIPYFKRSPFSTSGIRENLIEWSSDACPVIAGGLERLLSEQTRIDSILAIRKSLFATLLPFHFSLPWIYIIARKVESCLEPAGGGALYGAHQRAPESSSRYISLSDYRAEDKGFVAGGCRQNVAHQRSHELFTSSPQAAPRNELSPVAHVAIFDFLDSIYERHTECLPRSSKNTLARHA